MKSSNTMILGSIFFAFIFTGCSGSLLLTTPDLVDLIPGELGSLTLPTLSPTTGGVASSYRSGQTITINQSDPDSARKIYYTLDGSDPTTSSLEYTGPITLEGNGQSFTIRAIAVATDLRWTDSTVIEETFKLDPYRIYVGTGGGLSISSDNGASWTSPTELNGIRVNAIDTLGNKVYLATSRGLWIYDWDLDNWTQITSSTNGFPVNTNCNGITVTEEKIYLASWGGGVGISSDGGNTWTTITTADGLANNYVFDVHVYGNTLYAGTLVGLCIFENDIWQSTHIPDASLAGSRLAKHFFKSGSVFYLSTFEGLWKYENSIWQSVFPTDMGIYTGVDANERALFALSTAALYRSSDNGNTWTELNTGSGTTSLVGGIFIAGNYVYIGTDGGIRISNNNGEAGSWSTIASFTGNTDNTVYSVHAAP